MVSRVAEALKNIGMEELIITEDYKNKSYLANNPNYLKKIK